MEPSSRTPDGQPNRCPVCSNEVQLDPSQPAGDATCPFCGSLIWFDLGAAQEPIEDTPERIRIEFDGGCKDGVILEDTPRFLAEENGYRYYGLAVKAEVGMRVREVPFHEYGKLLIALVEHAFPASRRLRSLRWASIAEYVRSLQEQLHSAKELSPDDVEQITQRLQHVTVHVYEVTAVARTDNKTHLVLQFVEESLGL